MIDSSGQHEPTRDFSEFLARDIVRTLRHDQRFAPSARAARARKLGLIFGSIAASVVVLATGLVFGTSTGYASARVESDRQRDEMAANTMGVASQLATLRLDLARAESALAERAAEHGAAEQGAASEAVLDEAASELRAMSATVERIELDLAQNRPSIAQRPTTQSRGMPVTRALAVTLGALALGAEDAPVQQTIPTVDLPPASAKTTASLWNVVGVRHVAGGRLLVNDAGSGQVRLFDSTLATSTVVLDSNEYGPGRKTPSALIAFLGDSSLFPDARTRTVRVLDGNGRTARTISLPDVRVNFGRPGYIDDRGRLLMSAISGEWMATGDSLPIVRIDLASGRVDSLGRIKNGSRLRWTRVGVKLRAPDVRPVDLPLDPRGAQDLVPGGDDWAVLSDGSVAFVRGHDYHIDWLRPNGAMSSTPKLPFDWQRLADENKKQADAAAARLTAVKRAISSTNADSMRLRWRVSSPPFQLVKAAANLSNAESRTTIPDLDGNLWILPTATAPSQADTLIYDVVSRDGELLRRVRMPYGRSVAGFGPGGVVYLVSGDRNTGFNLERTKLPAAARR